MHQARLPRLFSVAAGALVALAVQPARALDRFEFTRIEMAVDVKLIVYAADQNAANAAAEAAYDRIHELNASLSDYDPQSELSRLSDTAGAGKRVPVGDDLWRLLIASQEMSQASEGAFDVTVGPIVRLWRRARRNGQMPSAERLREALAVVGYRNVVLDRESQTVEVRRAGTRLDLGGIAKGFAADEALAVLRRHGCPAALVGLAGDISVGDPPPNESAWTVAIEPPRGDATLPPRRVRIVRQAVSTSGDTSQFVEIDGVRYSHIVDPKTGLGLTRRGSVTTVAPTCMTADALASAACVLGPERGKRLIESIPGAAGLFLDVNVEGIESSIETKGMASYLK